MACPPVEPSPPNQASHLSSLFKLSKKDKDELKQHGLASNAIFRNVSHVVGAEGPMKKMASLIFGMVLSAANRAKRTVARKQTKQSPVTKKTSRAAQELFEKEIGEQ